MKRFVDLGDQTGNCDKSINEKEFSFYCTVTDKFENFCGNQTWNTQEELIQDCISHGLTYKEIERLTTLIPDNFFKAKPDEKRYYIVFQMQISELKFEKVFFNSKQTDEEIDEYFEDSCGGVYKWWRIEDLDSTVDNLKLGFYIKLFMKLKFVLQHNKCDNMSLKEYKDEVEKKIENLQK